MSVSIVANEMPDFIDKIGILREVTAAPILCATENYTEKEHHEAL